MGFKKRVFSAALALAAFFAFAGAAWAGHADRIGEFLKRTPLSLAEQADVLDGVKTAPSRTEWVMSGNGRVYALALCPVQKDNRPNVQVKLEELARTRAETRARYLLYLRAMPESRKARYASEESVAEAMSAWDRKREEGARLKPDISAAIVTNGWGFALLRAEGEALNSLGAQIENMTEKELDTAYCASLYPKAKALFDEGEYEKALPVYRELHTLRWAVPAAYLDAAECFLHTGDKVSAARLAEETVTELEESMNSALLERAGDILLESGGEDQAGRLYRKAAEKLRQE